MTKVHLKACPVCGGQVLEDYLHCTDHYASREEYDLVRCTGCGFLFTQDFPDEKEIGVYYETPDYISHSDTKKGLMNRIYHLVRSYMLNQKGKMVEDTASLPATRKGTVLDIGCGTGYFLETMKRRGWDTLGVEKSPAAAESARKHFGLDIRADLSLVDDNGRFDIITLWHVLEHLQDPAAVFGRLRTLLNKGGKLIIAVPNSASYDAEYYREYWAAYDVPRHLWHFAPDTFSRLVNREGFRIVKYAPMPFDAFYVSMLSEKYKGNKNSFVSGLWRGAIAGAHALRNPQKSSSIIYILERKQ